jgi:hypothetical protein
VEKQSVEERGWWGEDSEGEDSETEDRKVQ